MRRALVCFGYAMVLGLSPSASAWDLVSGFFQARDTFGTNLTYEAVTFSTPFPVGVVPVVITLTDEAGGNSALVRITDITNTGFRAALVEPAGYDGNHIANWFSYVAMTPGSHRLPDGTRIDAGTISTSDYLSTQVTGSCSTNGSTGACQAIVFDLPFASPPIFFSDIQTMNNEVAIAIANEPFSEWPISCPWLSTSHLGVDANQAEIALDLGDTSLTCPEAGGPTHVTGPIVAETIGWIALAESEGEFDCSLNGSNPPSNGSTFQYKGFRAEISGRGEPAFCSDLSSELGFDTPAPNSGGAPVMVHLDTLTPDFDGGWVRRCDDGSNDLEFFIEEDDLAPGDGERGGNGAVMASIMAMGSSARSQFEPTAVDIAVSKTNNAATYDVGDILEYSISVTATDMTCGSVPNVALQDHIASNGQVVDTDCVANATASCIAGQDYGTDANNIDIVSQPYLIDLGSNGQVDFTMQVLVVE